MSKSKMTNEEANILLRDCIKLFENGKDRTAEEALVYLEQHIEALNMAIKALKERPQGEWIPITTRELTDEEKEKYDEIVPFMWACPIPEVDEDVLVTTDWGDVQITTFTDGGDIGTYFDDMDDDEVVAWMPLPEPYKKGDSEAKDGQ